MKNIICSMVCALSLSSLFAGDSMPSEQNLMNEIICPKAKSLTWENVLSGDPIHAYHIDFQTCGNSLSCLHQGYFVNGLITTNLWASEHYLNTHYATWENGSQSVSFFDGEGEAYYNSESTSWTVKTFNGEKYVVHYHDFFWVYTNSKTQFVMLNS